MPAGGGEPTVLTTPDAGHGELDHYWPSFLPGGRAVLFTIVPQGGLAEQAQVAVLDLRTGQRKTLMRGASQAAYVETGHLVYASAGTLRAVRFDPVRLEVSGDPVPVVEQVLTKPNGTADFSLSRTGTLVYVAGTVSATTQLTWVDRAGRPTGTVGPPGPYRNPALSPDGTRVAVERTIRRAGRKTSGSSRWRAAWRRASRSIPATTSIRSGRRTGAGLRSGRIATAGYSVCTRNPRTAPRVKSCCSKHRRARRRIAGPLTGRCSSIASGTASTSRLGLLPRAGTQKPQLFEQTPFNQELAQVSPTGQWIAYGSAESGRPEVYVGSFPTPGGKYQISKDGGIWPRWRRDGKELFFYSLDGQLTAVPVAGETALDVGTAVPLFRAPLLPGGPRPSATVPRDARRAAISPQPGDGRHIDRDDHRRAERDRRAQAMSLSTGSRLGPYEILSALGAGGMGEVYKARDTTLDRDVAIKILPDAFVADPERVARFQREAKTLASLNHPNIGGIYGLEERGDRWRSVFRRRCVCIPANCAPAVGWSSRPRHWLAPGFWSTSLSHSPSIAFSLRIRSGCRAARSRRSPMSSRRSKSRYWLPSTNNFHRPDRTAFCCRCGRTILQNNWRSTRGDSAARLGRMLTPSSRWPTGSTVPVAATIDAVRSIVMATCADVFPAGRRAGQRRINGTRMPPSHRVLLRLLKGALRESHSPPLSFVKSPACISARPCRSSAERIAPTPWSARSNIRT